MRNILTLAVVIIVAAPIVRAEVYEIDSSHSGVGFRVRHLVGRVSGRFTQFSGTIDFTPGKPETWKVDAAIDPASINTDNEKRDGHLKTTDFFDIAKCPAMAFKSTKVADIKGDTAKLHGELTMHCMTKPVVLDLALGGTITDARGTHKAGFSAKGTVNRKDFGIVWNKMLDNGGLILGEEVDVVIDVESSVKPAGEKTRAKK